MANYIDSHVSLANTQAFWDPKRLQNLKLKNTDPASLKAAAQEFTSLMFQMLIKSMRDAQQSFKSELFSSEHKQYEEMMDQQWALHMAHTEHNGIVDVIIKQFAQTFNHDVNNSDAASTSPEQARGIHRDFTIADQTMPTQNPKASLASTLPTAVMQGPQAETPATLANLGTFVGKEDFVNKLLPYAIKAAKLIGADPKLLLAQAALETGWGTKIAKLPDGTSSNNLFGIKAGGDWQGKKIAIKTTEYTDGILQRKVDQFRAYSGIEASFKDYARLISDNMRYHKANASAKTPEFYAQTLQDAGFATDPNYAQKIMQIYNGLMAKH